jgi:hypothetical protein
MKEAIAVLEKELNELTHHFTKVSEAFIEKKLSEKDYIRIVTQTTRKISELIGAIEILESIPEKTNINNNCSL